jgi:hypothetical protein
MMSAKQFGFGDDDDGPAGGTTAHGRVRVSVCASFATTQAAPVCRQPSTINHHRLLCLADPVTFLLTVTVTVTVRQQCQQQSLTAKRVIALHCIDEAILILSLRYAYSCEFPHSVCVCVCVSPRVPLACYQPVVSVDGPPQLPHLPHLPQLARSAYQQPQPTLS